MTEFLTVLKGFLDPYFLVFILLIISFVIVFRHFKKKSDTLILLFCIIFAYGAGIAPVANYLCYTLEKDYINNPVSLLKNNIDTIVVLGNGTREILSMKETFNTEFGSLRLLQAVAAYNQTGAEYFVCSGKGPGKLSEAHVLARSAESLGIPKEKIRKEADSNNTAENAAYVDKTFDNRKIRIGLVTSAFHMQRSEREFKKYFNHVTPVPAHFLYASPTGNPVIRYMPQSAELYKTSVALKEIIAQACYRLK